jgi:transglutaminase-like putative cysteine protease
MTPTPALLAGLLIVAGGPSGRPPTGPLQRYEPRIYDITFDVTLTTYSPFDLSQPVIFQSTYSTVESDSLTARLWLGGREDTTLRQRTRLDDGFPFQTRLAVMPVESYTGTSVRFRVGYRVTSWSSRIRSEAAAASITWPREWPAEVRDGLQPQMYIQSDDPLFARAVEDASGGQLHLVPPYLAAKDLVRYVLRHVRTTGSGEVRGNLGVLRGLKLVGASQAAGTGLGGPNDLVCACVAILRAAGIPARPVIGLEESRTELGGLKQPRVEFVTWAEFYLPDAGWVPFDPVEMRGRGVLNLDVRRPWPEFGTMDDLNRRVPLAYHFVPPATLEAPFPAVWGWDPRPGGDPGTWPDIKLDLKHRGRSRDDPG